MSFLSSLAGLFGIQTSNPVATQSLNAEQGVVRAMQTGQAGEQQQANTNATNLENAQQNVTGAAGQANTILQNLLSGTDDNLAPAIASGQQGNTALEQYAASNPTFHAPTAAEVEQTPGYQFQLQQGTNAITNQAAASGLNDSGSTLAALTQYGQGLAGTYYQNAFNNAQQAFQTNQNTTLSNLQALIGSGATAEGQQIGATEALGGQEAQNLTGAAGENAGIASTEAALGQQSANSIANLGLIGSTTAGNFATNYGEAQAGHNIGNSAAIGGGISSLAGLLALL